MYIFLNKNPHDKLVGDCVIRAISILLNQDWYTTYLGLCIQGYIDCDMPSSDSVWGNYLEYKGFKKTVIPNECPDCITVRNFSKKFSQGRYLLAVGGHVVTVVDGSYFDTWDSGDRVINYLYQKAQQPQRLS